MLDSPTDLLILLVVIAVVFFGSSKIPEIFRSLGRAMGEFKKGRIEAEMEIQQMYSQPSANQSVEELEKKLVELQKEIEQLKQSRA
ncbi:twin arginine-targeting protein translocase [Sulfolobus sp. A20]|uniref:twin-arginine translocase TatA/TatE family subunit n=1 Tax=Saccharolobus sp. A20 TaxID=1891280 RepID=UPI0008462745|nr:twin-arginine translocase TatA/TatE family subunit [Sulfolobus sp. A20]TRM75136.1 twin-arginine translocase TatA/TatE family subunit [Sulfolobus sp. E5]TRM76689.1 twin-arginine translocase TatA/TatE family subunit [Sulfolobus sp. B5]TRM81566.1 twin-arginine translocase TatA/TatE family subunit [Sulfolobus sp. D5]TRM81736.1 twin-arginine translocase TatA/TatE family subunit [Sulfolobus sp. A20-N-F6]TRM87520.1 twin-arginine translocase TatA/TatE family subunit [Sulfolobus sp. C3]TRM96511.1 t